MIDLIDIFDLHQSAQIGEIGAAQAGTAQRLTVTSDKLRELEQRYERMRLINAALWELLKVRVGVTDGDLKLYIEKVDRSDGKLDGKLDRKSGAIDCPTCKRRILRSAVVCAWCGKRLNSGDAFRAT